MDNIARVVFHHEAKFIEVDGEHYLLLPVKPQGLTGITETHDGEDGYQYCTGTVQARLVAWPAY